MRAMAYQLFSYLASHPLIIAISVLLLFTLPIFHMLVFFWPLIVSTALGVLAVISFGRQSEKHSAPMAGCSTAESAWQQDMDVFPSPEEKISNVLMVGNQEVTWLEWLHNEDARKVCGHQCDSAVWDAYECDSSVVDPASIATIDASKTSTYKEDAPCDAPFQAKDKGKLCAGGSKDEGKTSVSALVLTEEESERASLTVFDGFRGSATVLEVVNKEEGTMNTPILRAVDERNVDSAGEGHMCRFDRTAKNSIVFTTNGASNTHAPTCAEGEKGQMSVEALCVTDGFGNESAAVQQDSLHSAIHSKNEVSGYATVGGDEVAGIAEAAIESDLTTCDIEGTLNKCVLEGKTGLLGAVNSTLEGTSERIPYMSEPKVVPTHELDALDLNKTISSSLQTKGADAHGTRHVDKQDDAEMGSNQLETQGPQWDVSDGEEDRSSLRFSFFHSSSLTG